MIAADAVFIPRLQGRARFAAHDADVWKLAALGLFTAWTLLIGAAHEPWFDEAQAWLLARDNGFIELVAKRARYEGSPGLWHVILWVAIRCGLPYSKLYLLSAGFATAGAAVVLWRAPFPAYMRLGIVFSYFFAYQYACLARSYSVDLLLIPLAAACFAGRAEKPLRYALVIGLLANLNAHGFVAGAVMGLELGWSLFRAGKLRGSEAWIALAIASGLGLLALGTAWQPADSGYIRPKSDATAVSIASKAVGDLIDFLRHAFLDRLLVFSDRKYVPIDALLGFAVMLVALIPSIRLIARGNARFVSAGVIGVLLAFSSVVYTSPWHSGLLFLFWVFAQWVSWPPQSDSLRRQVLIGFGVIAIGQMVQTARTGIWELNHTYSPAGQAARFIDEYHSRQPTAKIAAFGFKTFAMQPYWAGNRFANYNDGASRPGWIDWRKGAPWDPFESEAGWKRVLEPKPNLIVASLAEIRGSTDELLPLACAAGYVETRRFQGTMIWRGAPYEDDTLAIFEPGSSPACAKVRRGHRAS